MPERDEDGRWLPGHSGNPDGKNGWETGWIPYGIRLRRWLALPVSDIRSLLNNPARFEALSSIDAACVLHVAGMLAGCDRRGEREAALDRTDGKPKQTIVGDTDNPVPLSGAFTLTFGTDGNEDNLAGIHHSEI